MKAHKALSILGVSIAFISMVSIMGSGIQAHAKDNNVLTFDKENRCTLGYYPTKIDTTVNSIDIINNGTLDTETNTYLYKNERYAIIHTDIDLEHNFQLSNGDSASSYIDHDVAIKCEPLSWYLFDKQEGYVDLICTNIIDRMNYSDTASPYEYLDSKIKSDFAPLFYKFFSSDEQRILQKINGEYITIPDQYSQGEKIQAMNITPTDYSILKGLSSHLEEPNMHAPFWTQSIVDNRMVVIWNESGTTNCLSTDPRIGVVPMIRCEYSGSFQGGGSTISTNNPVININFTGNVVMIIIGAIFIIGGGVVLIIIMRKWYLELKVNTKLKVKPKTLVGSGITLTILIIGLYIFSFGTVVKVNPLGFNSNKDIHGYYSGNGYDENFEFGSSILMGLTDDYQVYRYYGNPWDEEGSATNFTYYIQPGIGRWEYKDGLLTIYAAPEWTRYNFEGLETTYTDANGVGSFIKYVGYEGTAYQWYHTNNRDPKYGNVKFGETTEVW